MAHGTAGGSLCWVRDPWGRRTRARTHMHANAHTRAQSRDPPCLVVQRHHAVALGQVVLHAAGLGGVEGQGVRARLAEPGSVCPHGNKGRQHRCRHCEQAVRGKGECANRCLATRG